MSSTSIVKGRAAKARPLACFLWVAALIAVAFPGSAAAIQPKAPFLTGTNPPSPSAALRPFIQGDADGGVITSAIGSSVATRLGPVARAVEHPTFLITIYADDATCSNPMSVVAAGTAAALEEPGIQVAEDVSSGASTYFFAKQTDPEDLANPSECSKGILYRHVDGPPAEPTFTGTDPVSPSGDNFPNLIGSAPAQTTVSIYGDSSCSGATLATGTADVFEKAGIEIGVADNSTTTFYARAEIAGFTSTCSSSSVTYSEVTSPGNPGGEGPGGGNPGGGNPGGGGQESEPKPPNFPGRPPPPTLRAIPGHAANDNTPTVTGKAPGAWRVEIYGSAGCDGNVLAAGTASQFTGLGLDVQVANDTTVTFYGISVDSGWDRSPCSEVPAVYVEDSTAPHTRITSGPAAKTRKHKAVFRFADIAGDTATSFFCKLDRRQWKSCRAPLKLKGLGLRRHVLKVKATDAAGNEEQGMAKRRFRVVRNY